MMQRLRANPFVGVLVAGSLFVSSTGSVAATTAAAVPQVNPWAALTAMSGGAPAAALCGASAVAAAAQTAAPGCVLPVVDAPVAQVAPPTPVPIPPVEPVGGGFGFDPLLLALGALAAGALIYFVLNKDKDDEDETPS
jgi:hypothetical protein